MARTGIVAWFKRRVAQLRGSSLQRGDHMAESKWRDQVENTDAWTAAQPPPLGDRYDFPPNYVPPADEGRPRH